MLRIGPNSRVHDLEAAGGREMEKEEGKIMGGEAEGQNVTGMDNKQKERGWVGTRSGPHYGRAGKLRFGTTAAEGEREREKRKGK